jgi:5-aminopentanamidase
MDVVFGDSAANADRAIQKLKELGDQGVDLAVFPEAFLTGYCVSSPAQAREISIPRNADAIQRMDDACQTHGVTVVVGFSELGADEKLYNTAVLLERGQAPRFYRKTHLPFLGLDRFTEVGDELEIFETRHGKIGILICFDLRPPEAARTLALKGAELIVLPTNWPVGAEVSADHVSIARAAENKVFVATCNRIGVENGTTFIGRSKIIHTSGRVLSAADGNESALVAEIDLSEARQKRIVNVPGEYEMEVFDCRQPELYEIIVKAKG